jgi:hypothetical protein
VAEGSFFTKNNLDSCFQLKQRIHTEVFVAFGSLFDTKRKITIENDRHAQFSVSSKKDIQTVINFFSSTDNPSPPPPSYISKVCGRRGRLLRDKLIQYKN